MRFVRRPTLLVALALACAQPLAASADSYPSKPIRFIVPAAAGGPTEVVTRMIAEKMTQSMGVPVLTEAKPGGGGNVGADFVAKSAPDGYTILMATLGTHAVNVTLYKKMPFDPVKDFAPITQAVSYPLIVVVNPSLPVHSIKELIDYAKKNPGKLNRASGGSGTSMHLSGEYFNSLTGIQVQHIPYKGSSPALADLVGGQVDLAFDSMVVALPLIRGGKLRAIAVTSEARSPVVPDVPAIAETVPGYAMTSWIGVLAPAGTPRPIVDRLNTEIVKALNAPDVKEKLLAQAAQPVGNTPEQFAEFMKRETEKWGKVVKASGATAD